MDFLDLIQKARAEGADTVSAPTFPFTPPAGSGGSQQNNQNTNNILLQTDTVSINKQKRTIVRIYIDATENKISSFTISISFDPAFFQVLDSNTTESGTQINFLDSVFSEKTNTVNNSTGLITLQASVENMDQATTLARTIAEIEFIPLKEGASEIKIIEENSNLLNTSSVDILNSTNSINFNISSTNEQSSQNNGQNNTIYIPKTALNQDLKAILSITGGLLLISSGIYIIKLAKNGKNKPD